jgi:hypothetical protein
MLWRRRKMLKPEFKKVLNLVMDSPHSILVLGILADIDDETRDIIKRMVRLRYLDEHWLHTHDGLTAYVCLSWYGFMAYQDEKRDESLF